MNTGKANKNVRDLAIANPKGIKSFSPALADGIGLRWVNGENTINSEGVEFIG